MAIDHTSKINLAVFIRSSVRFNPAVSFSKDSTMYKPLIQNKHLTTIFLAMLLSYEINSQTSLSIYLSEINPENGLVIDGQYENDSLGMSVSNAGDVNGDGIDDFLVGADDAGPDNDNRAGMSYVVYGDPNGFPNTLNPADLDGSNGIVLQGENPGDLFGKVNGTGDFNGDGINDILVGARVAKKIYIIYGSLNSLPSPFLISEMDATQGFIIDGTVYTRRVGTSVRFAGDVNGDGFTDVVLGAPELNNQQGKAYVVFGSNSFSQASIDLTTLDGENGFYIRGGFAGGGIGGSVNFAGDFNGDGIDDLIVGGGNSTLQNGEIRTGAAFVIFGKTDGFPQAISLKNMSPETGFIISGTDSGDWLGGSVSHAGDFNHDGIDDIIIGALGTNSSDGSAYIIFGSQSVFPTVFYVSNIDQNTGVVIRGLNGSNTGNSVSYAGDINGDGISDVIVGAYKARGEFSRRWAGRSYVIYGRKTINSLPIDLLNLTKESGFDMWGTRIDDFSGQSVSNAGDINGDGIDDVVVGAPGADPNNNLGAGKTYVVFGDDIIYENGYD